MREARNSAAKRRRPYTGFPVHSHIRPTFENLEPQGPHRHGVNSTNHKFVCVDKKRVSRKEVPTGPNNFVASSTIQGHVRSSTHEANVTERPRVTERKE